MNLMDHPQACSWNTVHRLLQLCTKTKDLISVRQVYSLIVKSGLDSVSYFGDHLIRLFASCGVLLEASYVFSGLLHRTVYTWHAIIFAHTKFGDGHTALKFYRRMLLDGIHPDKQVYTCCLKACRLINDLLKGMSMHVVVVKVGLDSAEAIQSVLIDMYATCRCIDEACQVFESSDTRDIVSWDTLMFGCVQQGQGLLTIDLFERMLQDCIEPSRVTFLCVLKACSSIGDVFYGRMIHEHLAEKGIKLDLKVGNTLIDMYAKCGNVDDACAVFSVLPIRDVVSWCALISGYTEYDGHYHVAINMFEKMQGEGVTPDKVTFLWILKACGSLEFLTYGRLIHNHILQSGVKLDMGIANTLIDMYSKCGSIREARSLYNQLPNPTAISCGAMIAGYAQHGDGLEALKIYEFLKDEGLELTNAIFVSTLKACKNIGAVDEGREVHDEVIRGRLEADILIGNTLIDFYAKIGYILDACIVFQMMKIRNVVTWGVMITGCVENGGGLVALEFYEEMAKVGTWPDKVTFLASLKACASTGAIMQGKRIHDQIVISGLEPDLAVGSCLVDMYCRCGCIAEACKVFENCPSRDIAMWGSMIAGYARHGSCSLVEKCLQGMQCQGLKPNDELITSILSTCNHASALDACHAYCEHVFYGGSSKVNIEHYSCIVNTLGRVGYLDEAAGLVHTMPVPPNAISWTGLLTSCGTYGDLGLGYQCFDHSIKVHANKTSTSGFMSSMDVGACMWEDNEKLTETWNTLNFITRCAAP